MSFLDSPFVKRSIEQTDFLRDRLIHLTGLVESRGQDEQLAIEYLHVLYSLVESEHLLHTRLRLSDDVEAMVLASQLDGAKIAFDSDDYANGDQFYRALKGDIKKALQSMDDTDLDTPVDLS